MALIDLFGKRIEVEVNTGYIFLRRICKGRDTHLVFSLKFGHSDLNGTSISLLTAKLQFYSSGCNSDLRIRCNFDPEFWRPI